MRSSADTSTPALLAQAARVVAETAQGRALDDALADSSPKGFARSSLQAIAYGTVRWYPRLSLWVGMLARREDIHPLIRALLCVGLHQLEFSRHPHHAIGHAAVEAARLLQQTRAAGFVNAVLRSFLRDRERLRERVMQDPVGRFAHPRWLIDAMRASWPGEWERILEANNEQPPMWLRVNRLRTRRAEYLELLANKGIEARPDAPVAEAIALARPLDIGELPGFAEGMVCVQDAAAQLAAELLDAQPGMRVLDACAAPGGKTCHILERTPDLAELVAIDRSPERLAQVADNVQRLRLQARLIAGDAGRPEDWLARLGEPAPAFDRILLDAPCSATGVIRRHPDIKLLRRPTDIPQLAAEQLRLLRGLWPLLSPGGRLLYVTCSVLRPENDEVIAAFLRQEPAATPIQIGRDRPSHGLQILPGDAGMDGFYYACLEKASISA